MKTTILAAALLAGFGIAAFAPQAANAASTGTINFSGKVYSDTCTIAVNGGATVALPVVATTAFAATANTPLSTSATNFNIALTGCDNNLVGAQMAFTGSNIDGTTGNIKNTSGTNYSNVEIELLSGANVINTSTGNNAPKITLASGSGSTTLTAEYITTSTTTSAGLVASSVGFTLTYQ
jgi:major type 1 subunit fimbrin (pilin)